MVVNLLATSITKPLVIFECNAIMKNNYLILAVIMMAMSYVFLVTLAFVPIALTSFIVGSGISAYGLSKINQRLVNIYAPFAVVTFLVSLLFIPTILLLPGLHAVVSILLAVDAKIELPQIEKKGAPFQ